MWYVVSLTEDLAFLAALYVQIMRYDDAIEDKYAVW